MSLQISTSRSTFNSLPAKRQVLIIEAVSKSIASIDYAQISVNFKTFKDRALQILNIFLSSYFSTVTTKSICKAKLSVNFWILKAELCQYQNLSFTEYVVLVYQDHHRTLRKRNVFLSSVCSQVQMKTK